MIRSRHIIRDNVIFEGKKIFVYIIFIGHGLANSCLKEADLAKFFTVFPQSFMTMTMTTIPH